MDRRVDKGFTQIDLPAVSQVLGELLEEPVHAHPGDGEDGTSVRARPIGRR
jgi:hypothetical protein